MSIFRSIIEKIFGASKSNAAAPSAPVQQEQFSPGAQIQQGGSGAPGSSTQTVDVDTILNGMAARTTQKLNWRESIVDLMKLLNLDSSLEARKELAQELGYSGDMNDSASMNIWLHKQVMRKLSQNGGRVPPELLQ